ncbi:hypothetical protein XM38_025850 [Halomicronema hongdechloris C2206]|uniref:Uncharacterized protein n=1 Tax=Halomicronema hongdechloris C2206 TaxID=1641165 RepID=A0A1Z3HMW1_9CYAN|nr:hypothetical protein XM38_025850 [Halomicronema hongdechloris C2206]
MQSARDLVKVLVTILLLAFIGLNLFRLTIFFLQAQHLI